MDAGLNVVRSGEPRLISPDYARVAVAVVPTDEELEIADQTFALVERLGRTAQPGQAEPLGQVDN